MIYDTDSRVVINYYYLHLGSVCRLRAVWWATNHFLGCVAARASQNINPILGDDHVVVIIEDKVVRIVKMSDLIGGLPLCRTVILDE